MVPYRTAFVPEAPVPIMPPICAPGAGSTGKKSGIPRSFSSAFRASYDTPGCTTASRSCSVDRGRVFQQRIPENLCQAGKPEGLTIDLHDVVHVFGKV